MLLAKQLLERAPLEPIDLSDARALLREFRIERGWAGEAPIHTPPSGNHKLMKSAWPTYAVSLAPSNESGVNVCPYATPKCRKGCIAFAGKGDLPRVKKARIDKTLFLAEHPRAFITLVDAELERITRKHDRVADRLNNFSDIPWELIVPWLFEKYPNVQFYDYTKDWTREGLDNYWLTLSASERTKPEQVLRAVDEYRNVAVVFNARRSEALPESYLGVPVVDGDKTDERFLDPKGYVVGLRAKGRMRKPEYRGFVKDLAIRAVVEHDGPFYTPILEAA